MKNVKKCRKRAIQRWSRWLTATESRIGYKNGLRARLGQHWIDFVNYANQHYKAQMVSKFTQSMWCCGKIDGTPCAYQHSVDPTNFAELHRLAALHLDHNFDLNTICTAWKQAMPAKLRSWDDGVDGDLICHLLFGVQDHPKACNGDNKWRAAVHFRCGTSKTRRQGQFCHESRYLHLNYQITSADLKKAA
jgi:hypothetical protein